MNRLLTTGLVFTMVIFLALSGCGKNAETGDIKIGVLIPLTGSISSMGENSQAALQLAKSDIEEWFALSGTEQKLTLVMEDTRADTATALQKLKELAAQGIRTFIGPFSSPELAHVKDYANQNDVLLISPSSVMSSLAIAGDNIFRFIPCDKVQSKATAALMSDDGIKWLLPVMRNDLWGASLLESTLAEYEGLRGQSAAPIKYDISGGDIPAIMSGLDQAVGEALLTRSPEEIGIYLLSYDEGTAMLNAAGGMENLKKVRWYGSSGFAMTRGILADPAAASFASSRGLPCTIYALDEAARHIWEPVKNSISGMVGRQPDSYAMISYDALWVLVHTVLSAGTDQNIDRLKLILTEESGRYFGASGNTWLNEAGDRAFGNFDFYGVRPDGGSFAWKRLAWYNSATGALVRIQ